ncbi:MAG TPA: SRPBCC domain-containing protein [Usitatibacteraceae bacterium]|nr:SRPBCC domain-containing protein [Usitatibacteraceae bacterium]
MTQTSKAVFRIVINGSIDAVWRELTKQGEPQAAVFNAWLHAQSLAVGQRMQMTTKGRSHVMVVGTVTAFDPPTRFAHTFKFTQFDDPECEVIYDLKQLPAGVECTLTVERMPVGTRTAKSMQDGGGKILNLLKAVVETGRVPLGTRLLYAMMDRMLFMLPKSLRAQNWPL